MITDPKGTVIDPALMTVGQAKEIVATGVLPALAINRQFVEGDHWQGGEGWIGPKPKDGEAGAEAVLEEISRAFTSKNVIGEVVERHTGGVVGREPGWTIVPRRIVPRGEQLTPAELASIDEINAFLTVWWDSRNAHGILSTMVDRVLYAGRQTLRLFVPASKLGASPDPKAKTGTIQAKTPEEAVLLIYPEAPLPEQATVYVDPDTKESVGMLVIDKAGKVSVEIVFQQAAGASGAPGAPVSGTDAPLTVIRNFSGEDATGTAVPLPLGGRLTMMEIVRRPLITEQIRQGQRALNLALSMVPRNVVSGGFLERILTNAQMPGEWKTDPDGTEHFVPFELPTGAGVTTFLAGTETDDEATGRTSLATPGVHFRDPVPVTSSVEGKNSHYEDILDGAAQRHVLMGDQAVASGISREQARADFEESLKQTIMLVLPLGRWMLETVIALVESFLNSPGKWSDNFRVEFRPYVNTGPLSSDEVRVNNESVAAGTLSLETAMQRMGITDIDAEMSRIQSQDDAMLAVLERQVAVVTLLTGAGMTLADAGEIVGMSPENITIMKKAQAAIDKRKADEAAAALAKTASKGTGTPAKPVASPPSAPAPGV